MSAGERRARANNARLWVDGFARADPERWAANVSQLLYHMDNVCREKLNSGRNDVFASIADLSGEWRAIVGSRTPNQEDEKFQDALFQATLERIARDGDLVFANDRQRARSRAFETVHYLRHLRQRTRKFPAPNQAPRLIEQIKAETKLRSRPDRRHSVSDLREAIENALINVNESPLATIAGDLDLVELADWTLEVFEDFVNRLFPGAPEFAGFQIRASEQILSCAFAAEAPPAGVVVAAGTGFGKTEAFVLPILFYTVLAKIVKCQRGKKGADAILVYPRRDLCNDQAARILAYLIDLNAILESRWSEQLGDLPFEPIRLSLAHGGMGEGLKVPCPLCRLDKEHAQRHGGSWTGADDESAWLVAKPEPDQHHLGLFRCGRRGPEHGAAARAIVYQIDANGDSFDIAITNLDTLHRRLMDRHGRQRLFPPTAVPPRIVVADEMHIYEGQTGAHASNIMRRLRQRIRAMGVEANEPVMVGASATVHAPNELLSRLSGVRIEDIRLAMSREEEEKRYGLEYFFFLQSPGNRLVGGQNSDDDDDPDALPRGQQRFVSEQAAMIQAAMCLQHTMKADSGDRPQKRRVLGFVDSLDVATRLARNLDNAEWQDSGPRSNGGSVPMRSAPLYALRLPSGRPGAANALPVQIAEAANSVRPNQAPQISFPSPGRDCPRYDTGDCRQPPHHLLARCSRYEIGECWHVMGRSGEEGLRPLLIQKHQSGRRDWAFPHLAFRAAEDDDNWRLLVTTSALEVGFDHPELIATWQYHAPPSVAGFLQRKGRGGRGIADRPLTMMSLGMSDSDVFAFQHHDRYVNVDDQRDLVCWVDPENPSIRRQHVVAAIFDFCASIGNQKAYSVLDFDFLAEVLRTRRTEVQRWVRGSFPVLTTTQADELVRAFERELNEVWLRPIVPIDLPWAERTPVSIFSGCSAEVLRERAHHLSTRSDLQAAEARDWFLAFAAGRPNRVTAPDFFSALPNSGLRDPDLILPAGTIPQPLGRDIVLFDNHENEIGRDAAEFALNVFLPGGFKIRFNNRLWAAPWEPPPGWIAPIGTRLSQAALQISEPGRARPPGTPDVWARQVRTSVATFLAQQTELDQARQDELLAQTGSTADIVIVHGLQLRDLGPPVARKFSLDTATNSIRRTAGTAVGAVVPLTRDPHLTTQKITLPLRPQRSGASRSIPPFSMLRFHHQQPLVVMHYANLVHCYPNTGGETTVAVHFRASDTPARPLVPAVIMRTEALELTPDPALPGVWSQAMRGRGFWRRVSDRFGGELVVRQAVLDSFYMIEGCIEALAALELSAGEFANSSPTRDVLFARFQTERGWLQELDLLLPHAGAVADVFAEAAAWIFQSGLRRAQADTLALALVHAAAEDFRLSPNAFRVLVEPYGDDWRILIYDNNEGGGGNARRLFESIDRWPDLTDRLAQCSACSIASGDRAIATALSGAHSADGLATIHSQQRASELITGGADPATLRRLERLIDGPEIAAFNLYAFDLVQRSREKFGGTPPLRRLLREAGQTPALDPRAEALRRIFRRGDTPELGPRLRAVLPLCEAGCPYCIGHTEDGYADRTLLEELTAA